MSDLGTQAEPLEALERLTRAQALSTAVIRDLLAAAPARLDDAINAALARLGESCGSDRNYLFQRQGPDLLDNTHEWCAPGIAPMIDTLQGIPASLADPWWPALARDGQVHIADVLTLDPDDPLRGALEPQGIRSLLTVPLIEDGQIFGFMGYDSVLRVRNFLEGEIHLIRSVANIIATQLTRRRIEGQIAEARHQQDLQRLRLEATLAASPDPVMELDADLRITAVHASDRVRLPMPVADLLGRRVTEVLPPHVAQVAADIRAAIDRDGIAMAHQCPIDVDGRVRWYSVSAARRPAQTPDEQPGFVAVLRDVTDRKAQLAEIERLGQIVRNTTNLVVTTDSEGRIDWVNPAFEQRTGYTLAEARGHKPGALLRCPETDPGTSARIRAALDARVPITAELLNATKSGERYWVEMNIQPMRDAAGRLTGFMAIQTDTTPSRERALSLQRALSAEEAARYRLKSAVEVMQEAVILFDAEQRLVLWNGRFRAIFPLLASQLRVGLHYRVLLQARIDAGYVEGVGDPADWLQSRLDSFALRARVTSMVRHDERWYRQTDMPTPDGGRIILMSDVTDLKDAEQRALADRARAMDASQDGIALLSASGHIRYLNSAAARLLAVPDAMALMGTHWGDALRFVDPDENIGPMIQAMAQTGSCHAQVRLYRQDGSLVVAELSGTRSEDGGVLCFLRDATDRLAAEAERERLREDLSLASRRAELSVVAMGLAHDFNNLLAAISAAASLIDEDSAPQTRLLTDNIATAVDQAAGLVRRLMALGRQSGGRTQIDLRAPLLDVASLVRPSLRPPTWLDLALPDTAVPTRGDSTGIMQMALNLCLNARDALHQSPPPNAPGRIRLTLAMAGDAERALPFDLGDLDPQVEYAAITVSDNGPGMNAETCARIFTPYFSTKGEQGTGLGVPVAAEVVRLHDGALHLDSAPGEGTRFVILLPLATQGD
jgi:PAS domain S-box-containing protein